MTPERTCVGCRRKAPVDELVRVARTPQGALTPGRSLPGRGAWLCGGSVQCFERAVQRRGFDRAFGVPIERAALEALGARLGSVPAHGAPGPKRPTSAVGGGGP